MSDVIFSETRVKFILIVSLILCFISTGACIFSSIYLSDKTTSVLGVMAGVTTGLVVYALRLYLTQTIKLSKIGDECKLEEIKFQLIFNQSRRKN